MLTCPFCGELPSVKYILNESQQKIRLKISCDKECVAFYSEVFIGCVVYTDIGKIKIAEQDLISRWNTRY